jgi:hypothetical protein
MNTSAHPVRSLLCALAASVVVAACSSSSSPTTPVDSGMQTKADTGTKKPKPDSGTVTHHDAGQGDAGSGDAGIIIDPDNCVAPGTPNNSEGVGGYCSPNGEQCLKAGPGGTPTICTADIGGTPAHAWFCTYPCTTQSMCGTGNTCVTTAAGSGCVPDACLSLADGGFSTDGASDALQAEGGSANDGGHVDGSRVDGAGLHDAAIDSGG